MMDSHKALGQRMEHKASDKFYSIYIFNKGRICFPVFVEKPDTVIFQSNESIVRDGHPMGVAAQIVEYVLGLIDGFADIDHPPVVIATVDQAFKALYGAQRCDLPGELQFLFFITGLYTRKVLLPEHRRQRFDRQQVIILAMVPVRFIKAEHPCRYQTVEMKMIT